MPFDFSSYQVAPGEKPASSAKFNNFLNAVQAGMNAMPIANLQGYPADANKFLNGGGAWTTPITDMAQVFIKAAPTAVTGATPTDLFGNAFNISAGRMTANSALRIWAMGDYTPLSNARTMRLALTLGGATIWDSVSGAMPGSGGAFGWEFNALIQNLGSLSSQLCSGVFEMNNAASPATGTGKIALNADGWPPVAYAMFTGVQTNVNTAGGQSVKLTLTHGGTGPTMTCKAARLEVTA